jgi:hypothetical protein
LVRYQGSTYATADCSSVTVCYRFQLDIDDSSGAEWSGTIQTTDISTITGDIALPAGFDVVSSTVSDTNNNTKNDRLTIDWECTGVGCDSVQFGDVYHYSFEIVNDPLTNSAGTNLTAGQSESITWTATASMYNDNTQTVMEIFGAQTQTEASNPINVTASVDASLSFSWTGVAANASIWSETCDVSTASDPELIAFGTLTPNVPKIACLDLDVATNAANGYLILVNQSGNMTFNSNQISQFKDATAVYCTTDSCTGSTWASPSTALGHLGYTSDDADLFSSDEYVALPTKPGATAVSDGKGAVAYGTGPTTGDTVRYALKIESTASLPQAPASLSQAYTHEENFIVVGLF